MIFPELLDVWFHGIDAEMPKHASLAGLAEVAVAKIGCAGAVGLVNEVGEGHVLHGTREDDAALLRGHRLGETTLLVGIRRAGWWVPELAVPVCVGSEKGAELLCVIPQLFVLLRFLGFGVFVDCWFGKSSGTSGDLVTYYRHCYWRWWWWVSLPPGW